MKYDPDRHHRCSIRLKGYYYSEAGAYFVTICTHSRECLFGDIGYGEMRLDDVGTMVRDVWYEIPEHFPHADIDEFVVMPNHVHGIIVIVGAQFIAPFDCSVWQRNYYEHIIRSEEEMNRIRRYIIDNPAKWAEDENNPANIQ